jgi:riboflavin kinase/FMN adenylyltransferase
VDTNILCAETHIFDFDGDLYGKTIRIEFLHFLREETKFDSVEQMAEQIKKDIETARNYIEK